MFLSWISVAFTFRQNMYKQQQRLATSLFKAFGTYKYYFWNVMSMVLQVWQTYK